MGAASARLWRCCQWTAAFATLDCCIRRAECGESSLAEESRSGAAKNRNTTLGFHIFGGVDSWDPLHRIYSYGGPIPNHERRDRFFRSYLHTFKAPP
jgi:hypothetical protein